MKEFLKRKIRSKRETACSAACSPKLRAAFLSDALRRCHEDRNLFSLARRLRNATEVQCARCSRLSCRFTVCTKKNSLPAKRLESLVPQRVDGFYAFHRMKIGDGHEKSRNPA